MKALVTGGTGTVGSKVIDELLHRGVSVRALIRNQRTAKLPGWRRNPPNTWWAIMSLPSACSTMTQRPALRAAARRDPRRPGWRYPFRHRPAQRALHLTREPGHHR